MSHTARIDLKRVLGLLRAGKSNVDVAISLGCSREYVRQCRNKFENQGLLSSEATRRRRGRATA